MDWSSVSNVSRFLLACLADASVRAVVLALLALLLVPFVRRSCTAQHTAWTLVLAGMLALPFLRPVVPATYVNLPLALTPVPAKIALVPSNPNPSGMSAPVSPPPANTSLPAPPLWPLFLVAAYLAGVMLFGARLLVGVSFTRRALRNTRTIHSELWAFYDLIADTNVDLSLEESDFVRVPLTTGSQLTRVILPADWRAWPREKLTAILAHELAHARRRDPFIAVMMALNKCLFWFHPLAWWLEHRLPVLAEHAADDAALAITFDTQAYARLLLDSAARLDGVGNRLIWHLAAMSGPVVAQRIRRVLDLSNVNRLKPLGKIGRAMLVCLGATLIWISTAVDVPSLAAGQANRPAELKWSPTTAEQAAAMEQELAANPEDETTRGKLLRYYMLHRMEDRRIPLVLWLIDHHPESDLLEMGGILPFDGPNVYQEARNHWRTQVSLHPNDARVLLNAARSGAGDSLEETIGLLKRVRKLDPARGTEPLARIYSSILVGVNDNGAGTHYAGFRNPGLAAQIRNELQSSSDIALVGSVARHVVEDSATESLIHPSHWDFNGLRTLATDLVTHAQTLEPQNRAWSDLMQGVNQLPSGSVPEAAQTTLTAVQTIRVGGMVQAQNLLESPTPIYPPEAKAAGVQGTVKLQIRIGIDGRVTQATAISGDPLLIGAALDAAKRYVYKPTKLNGQAAEVLTDVEIAFH